MCPDRSVIKSMGSNMGLVRCVGRSALFWSDRALIGPCRFDHLLLYFGEKQLQRLITVRDTAFTAAGSTMRQSEWRAEDGALVSPLEIML